MPNVNPERNGAQNENPDQNDAYNDSPDRNSVPNERVNLPQNEPLRTRYGRVIIQRDISPFIRY